MAHGHADHDRPQKLAEKVLRLPVISRRSTCAVRRSTLTRSTTLPARRARKDQAAAGGGPFDELTCASEQTLFIASEDLTGTLLSMLQQMDRATSPRIC